MKKKNLLIGSLVTFFVISGATAALANHNETLKSADSVPYKQAGLKYWNDTAFDSNITYQEFSNTSVDPVAKTIKVGHHKTHHYMEGLKADQIQHQDVYVKANTFAGFNKYSMHEHFFLAQKYYKSEDVGTFQLFKDSSKGTQHLYMPESIENVYGFQIRNRLSDHYTYLYIYGYQSVNNVLQKATVYLKLKTDW